MVPHRVDSNSLPIIERQVEDCRARLSAAVQISPEDIGGISELHVYLRQIKNLQNDFVKLSTTLSTCFIQRQALSRAKDVREDRRATNSEVSEFILMANNLLKGQGIDEVSDIDVYSTTSHLDNLSVTSEVVANTVDETAHNVGMEQPLIDIASIAASQTTEDIPPAVLGPGITNLVSGIGTLTPSINTLVPNPNPIVPNPNTSVSSINATVPVTYLNSNLNVIGSSGNVSNFNMRQLGLSQPPHYSTASPTSQGNQQVNVGMFPGYQPNPSSFQPARYPSAYSFSPHVQFNPPQPSLPSLYPPNIHPFQPSSVPQPATTRSQPQALGSVSFVPAQHQQHATSAIPVCPFFINMSQSVNSFSQSDVFMKYLLLQNSNNGSIEVFSGIAYRFHSWVDQIRSLVGVTPLTPIELLRILQSNSKDEPKSLIDNYLFTSGVISLNVFLDFWKEFSERFGSPKKIAEQIFLELEKFPEIKDGHKIGEQLRKLYDLCKVAEFNLSKSDELFTLHLSSGLSTLKKKLTPALRYNWLKHGTKYEKQHNVNHPPFEVFVSFLKESAADLSNKNYEDCLRQTYVERNPSANPKGFRNKVLYTDVSSEMKEDQVSKCPMHPKGSNHFLSNCNAFSKLALSDRFKKLKELKLCFKCFGSHMQASCDVIVKCEHCGKAHHSALHIHNKESVDIGKVKNSKPSKSANQALCTKICESYGNNLTCSKTILVYLSHRQNPSVMLKCYAIVDEHSNCTPIDSKVISALNLNSDDHNYQLKTCSKLETNCVGKKVSGLIVRGVSKDSWIQLPDALTNDSLPDARNEVGTPDMLKVHPDISHLASHFSQRDNNAEVLLLIGANCGPAMGTACHGSNGRIWVHDTPLGWALVGQPYLELQPPSTPSKCKVLKTVKLHDRHAQVMSQFLKKMDVFLEEFDDEMLGFSRDDQNFLHIMAEKVKVAPNGKVMAPLPLRDAQPLPSNQAAVFYRTKNTLDRLKLNPTKLATCVASMEKSLSKGFVEEVPAHEESPPPGKSWFLPTFAVDQPKKGKVRLVYDASAKYRGVSLNDKVYSGPDSTNELRGVLHRFREDKVGIAADIECMFNNFLVDPEHRDYLRFFWYKANNPNDDIVQFRATSHLFGCSSSPAVANYCLRFTTKQLCAEPFPKSQLFLNRDCYVDDCIASLPTSDEAIEILEGARAILSNFHIRLHKILSNSAEVLRHFPESECASDSQTLLSNGRLLHSTLGVRWDTSDDVLMVETRVTDHPFTKRGILASLNGLYDPLGIISALTLSGKLIQRQVNPTKDKVTPELAGCGWDDPLPECYRPQWDSWKSAMSACSKFVIPRSHIPSIFLSPTRELHVFVDASDKAICYIVYMRIIEGENVSVSFVSASAKVVPRCANTIPRSELCAAADAAQSTAHIVHELKMKPRLVRFYSDSMVTLGYIRNKQKRFSKYVVRRVDLILKHSNEKDWFYVSTSENPADLGTRGITPEELKRSVWFTGPRFLRDNSLPSPPAPGSEVDLPEEVSSHAVMKTSSSEPSCIAKLALKVSSWQKLINIVRCFSRLPAKVDWQLQQKGVSLAPRNPEVSTGDTVNLIIVLAQADAYQGDVSKLKGGNKLPNNHVLSQLAPFVDSAGVLRVGGRLQNSNVPFDFKYPIILSPNHPVSTLVIQHYHIQVAHQGRHITHGKLRMNGFHIQNAKSAINKICSSCVTCRKLRRPTESQIMANLPSDRLEEVPPFTYCGLDVFGPFYVNQNKSTRANTGQRKVWGLIFVCMTCRAVHIELMPGMDTSSFRNAFQGFVAIRRTPKRLRSDQGSSFISSRNQMEQETVNVTAIQDFLSKQDIEWVMNPPYASNFGGHYERKIGSIRRIFEGCMASSGVKTLSYDELHTMMQISCSIVNNTPLTSVSDDPNDPMPLTPAALLTLRESSHPPSLEEFEAADLLAYGAKRWRRVQYLAQQFWVRWRDQYLSSLQRRHKWKSKKPCIAEGDVVLIRSKTAHRNSWPMARVSSVTRSGDGLVRTVQLKLPPGRILQHEDSPEEYS